MSTQFPWVSSTQSETIWNTAYILTFIRQHKTVMYAMGIVCLDRAYMPSVLVPKCVALIAWRHAIYAFMTIMLMSPDVAIAYSVCSWPGDNQPSWQNNGINVLFCNCCRDRKPHHTNVILARVMFCRVTNKPTRCVGCWCKLFISSHH